MHLLLNLLPPAKKAELHSAFLYSFLQTMLIFVLAGVCLASFSLLSVRFIMAKDLSDVSRRSAPETQEFQAVSETIKAINSHMTRLDQVNGEFNDWTRLLLAVERATPPGVAITRYDVTPTGAITLSGLGETRDDVLSLRRNLEADPLFKDVKSPLSNILQRKDVRFEFTAAYADFRAPADFAGTSVKKKATR
jgi:Tfp pilus assembly protein PilN